MRHRILLTLYTCGVEHTERGNCGLQMVTRVATSADSTRDPEADRQVAEVH